ncbi:PilZ domain-containing protein [Candidatus Omnitrophota bacterium]
MREARNGKEKREFLRYDYNKPIKYSAINTAKNKSFVSKLLTGISKNLSVSGILFTTNATKLPGICSLLALDLDYKITNVCQEIESQTLILKNRVIGKVVRIEDNEDGTCGVGVAFVKKSDRTSKDIKNIEPLIK